MNASILNLDSNENLSLPLSFLQEILLEAAGSIDPRIYSDQLELDFRKSLSDYLGVDSMQILVGAGGDDIINLIAGPVMTSLTDAVLIEPTFSMYRKCLNAHKRRILSLDLNDDFTLDLDMVIDSLNGSNEVVFLCSPNNPSGNQFSRDNVRTIVESTNGLIVLDEAYVEFSGESLVDMTNEFENLIVLRTFSKAFGIAGLRVGYAVMNSKLAEEIRSRLLLPYPVCTSSLKVAIMLLERLEEVSKSIVDVQRTREQLCQELRKIPDIRVYPSSANFLLLEIPQTSRLFVESLQQLGIKIRDVDWVNTNRNLVRVTVPPSDELDRVVGCFKEVLLQ